MNDALAQVRMPSELRDRAMKVAEAERRSFSDWTRLLIEREVKAYEKAQTTYEAEAKAQQVSA